MSVLPGKKRPYQDHLRYKHMVARLQGATPQQLEDAIVQEIAKGRRWRIDAALEAGAGRWEHIDMLRIASDIGRFGRITAAARVSGIFAALGVEERVAHIPYSLMFANALRSDHARVAEYAIAQGASMHAIKNATQAVAGFIASRDTRKVQLLERSRFNFEAVMIDIARANDGAALGWLLDTVKINDGALGLLLSRTGHMNPKPEAVIAVLAEKGNGTMRHQARRYDDIDRLMEVATKGLSEHAGGEIKKMKKSGDPAEALVADVMKNMLGMLGVKIDEESGKKAANKNNKSRKPPKAG